MRNRKPVQRELSAGGVVARRDGQSWYIALVKTEHKRGPVWVLPKGHVELSQNERIVDAARREVQEEAGIDQLSVRNQLGVTRFTFQAERFTVRKTVHYFLMTTQQIALNPQAEEGLIDAAWFPLDEVVRQLAYDTDQDMVRRAIRELTGVAPRPSLDPRRRPRQLRIHR
jgi:ADP-ribose pyrophosphatase YjhB (NUDIX family)